MSTAHDEVTALRRQVAELHQGLESRTQIGTAVGILAGRLGIGSDRAWDVMRRVSTTMNVKVREVARVIVASHNGTLDPSDAALAQRVSAALGDLPLTKAHQRGGV